MNFLIRTTAILALAIGPATVWAGNGNNKNKIKVQRVPSGNNVAVGNHVGHCPPGLAKKAVPCVPPGQVKHRYRVGDRIVNDYLRIDDPYRHGLRRGGYYVRAGDYVYQIDEETHEVLNLMGAVADILD